MPLNLLGETFNQAQPEALVWWQLHTPSVVFYCEPRLAVIAACGEVNPDQSTIVAKRGFDGVRHKLVDDQTSGTARSIGIVAFYATTSMVTSVLCGSMLAQSDRS